MYQRHFDLSKDPFSIAPDPRFLFMSERHREALAHLLYGVSGTGGFVLFTGDIGTGKTTVCRCFLEQIPPNCNVAIVFNPKLSVLELLGAVCDEFHVAIDRSGGEVSLKTYVDALNVFLLQSHAAGQSNVLIVDEAQNLHPSVLEQLRLLTNLETHERKLLQIVLIGQPELRTLLSHPELEQLAQRVIARYHLESLNADESIRYIEHRLNVAGHTGALPFDARALHRIYALTRGVPRRINLLCGRALLGAWANGQHQVDQRMINKAAHEVFGDEPRAATFHAASYAALLLSAAGMLCVGVALTLAWQHGLFSAGKLQAEAAMAAVVPARQVPVAVPVPATPPAALASAVQPAAMPVEDLDGLIAGLPTDIVPAWGELARRWKLGVNPLDPCGTVTQVQMQCYRTSELNLPLLRQLDRPGVMVLQRGEEPARYAVLVGLDEKVAVLRWSGSQHRVSLMSLARFWRGDFATFWRPPPGYGADTRSSEPSLVYGRLAQQLTQLETGALPTAAPTMARLEPALAARLRAFQKGQGIKPDGLLGPMTLMQLDKALGLEGPSLDSGTL